LYPSLATAPRHSRLILERRGTFKEESAVRANELALAGDDAGATTWRRIMSAVMELANKIPPGRLH